MNHYDDKELLAYSFCDLPEEERVSVESHLSSCRRCQQRYSEIQTELRQIRNAVERESILSPEQVESARARFFERYHAVEQELEPLVLPLPVPARTSNPAAIARTVLAAAAMLVIGLFAWKASHLPQPEPAEVLAQTMNREENLRSPRTSVHQDFEVEIRQVKPEFKTVPGRLRVWSDSDSDRYASRWENNEGELQFAVWRPESGREYVYNARLGTNAFEREPQSGQTITLGEMDFEEATLEQMQAGFLHWLGNRRWEPISIASDVNTFRRRDGVEITVRRIETIDKEPSFRITAGRDTIRGRVELVAEVDAATYSPKIELVRLITDERVVELRLRAKTTQWMTSAMMEKELFWPSVRIEGEPGHPVIAHAPIPREINRDLSKIFSPAAPSEVDLEMAEMRARYALHQADACLGVPVKIQRMDHVLRIEALVETQERKNELIEQLADVSSTPFVRVDVKTVEEAVATSTQSAASEGAAPSAGNPSEERLEVIATDSPIKPALTNYLRRTIEADHGDPAVADVDQMVSEFSERIVSMSLSNLGEAWALRRLAERYGSGESTLLPPEAWSLLQEMIGDHLEKLNDRTVAIESDVQPLLSSIATRDRSGRIDGDRENTAQDWASQSLLVFQDVESTEAVTTGLFADSGYANGVRRERSAERGAAVLLRALPRLQQRLASLKETLTESVDKGSSGVSAAH